jgi:GAF domain-containing protein
LRTADVAKINRVKVRCTSQAEQLPFEIPEVVAALFNETKTAVKVVAEYQSGHTPSAKHLVVSVEENPASQHLLHHQTPLVIDNAQSDPRLAPLHELIRQRGVVSLLVLPLTIKKEVVGSMNLTTTEAHSFSTEEVNLAWSVTDQVAGALARARLDQARRLLSAAVEQSAESVIITDPAGVIIYVNPAFEKVSGYSQAEVVGQTPCVLKSGRQETAFYQELWATITAGQVWHKRLINKNSLPDKI